VLSELTAPAGRLAMVGLAKNTGKTEALAALLRELELAGRRVGVTSVGRDGEAHDVIDFRIDKPLVRLAAQSLLATTDSLLSASGLPFELLEDTAIGTPLGRVLVVRLKGGGAVEVAGPSAAAQIRLVSDAMLAHGAEQVLIDGAIDRRAASSPDVADGLVMSTGAVLSPEIGEVVEITRRAVDLVRIPTVPEDSAPARWLRARGPVHGGALLSEELAGPELPARFVLGAEEGRISELLRSSPDGRWIVVAGAVPEAFLGELTRAARPLRRAITVVAADPTRIFLSERDPDWYERQGVRIMTARPINLMALTVNPLAPQSHSFDSARLRSLVREAVPGVPVFDVLHPEYSGAQAAAAPPPPSLK